MTPRTGMQRFFGVWFLETDAAIAVALSVAFIAWATTTVGAALVDRALQGNRSAVYGTLVSAYGAMLGFVLAAASILVSSFPHQKLDAIRATAAYPRIWRIFTSASIWLGIATTLSFVAMLVDRDIPEGGDPAVFVHRPWILWLIAGSTAMVFVRVFRCVWVLRKTVKIIAPAVRPESDEARAILETATGRPVAACPRGRTG